MTYLQLKTLIKDTWGLSSKPFTYGHFPDDEIEPSAQLVMGSTTITIKPPHYRGQKTTSCTVQFKKPRSKTITYSIDLPLNKTKLNALAVQIMIDAVKHR